MRLVLPALLLALTGCASAGGTEIEGTVLAGAIDADLEERAGVAVTVQCPDAVADEGKILDCVVDEGGDRRVVRVTFDDDEGHYTYEVTGQKAP